MSNKTRTTKRKKHYEKRQAQSQQLKDAIDKAVRNPFIKLTEIAEAFDVSQPYVSQVAKESGALEAREENRLKYVRIALPKIKLSVE